MKTCSERRVQVAKAHVLVPLTHLVLSQLGFVLMDMQYCGFPLELSSEPADLRRSIDECVFFFLLGTSCCLYYMNEAPNLERTA